MMPRTMPSNFLICGALAAVLAIASPTLTAQSDLPAHVKKIMSAHGLPESSLSVYVQEVGENKPLLALNADRPRNPASTIKILTTLVALDTLGPAYTWRTRAYLDGDLSNGRLNGNLVIQGGGDPFMVVERWWAFVDGLRRNGLTDIGGDFVIDDSYFDVKANDPGAFDGQVFRTYNVVPNALLVNFKTVRFFFQANRANGSVQIIPNPRPANLRIDNQLKLGKGHCGGYQRGISFDIPSTASVGAVTFSGSFPAACGTYEMSRAVLTAPHYAYGTFKTLWEGTGGSLKGTMRIAKVAPEANVFYELQSLPLAEIISRINKYSSNVMSRQLLLTLAADQMGPPGTVENGRFLVQKWISAQNLEFPELVLDNGSGLSRDTRIAARSLSDLLLTAHHSRYMPEFMASLPLAGLDGTLRKRFRGKGMDGRLRIKTGRLDDVNAIAGYVLARSGRTYVVVALQNYADVHRGPGQEIQNALLSWVFDQ